MSGTLLIREYRQPDANEIVRIIKLNGQYDFPSVEGPEAMDRVAACEAAVALVAESGGQVVGYVKAVYDGSRALIHLLSVHPEHQGRGVGGALLKAVEDEMKKRGAPSIAVSVGDQSMDYWVKRGFRRIPVFLMLKEFSRE